jgi:hypothetical protein
MEMEGHVSTDPIISYQCINLPFLIQDTFAKTDVPIIAMWHVLGWICSPWLDKLKKIITVLAEGLTLILLSIVVMCDA